MTPFLSRLPRLASFLSLAGAALAAFAATPAAQVLGYQKLSEVQGGFTGVLEDHQYLPQDATALGDVDGDGVEDMAWGDRYSNAAGPFRGAVFVLLMNTDGTIKSTVHVTEGQGGFAGTLDDGDQFGLSVGGPGDIDFDGTPDLLVGSPYDDDGGFDRGAVYVLFLNPSGTVKSQMKISSLTSMAGLLSDGDGFGSSIAGLGNFDGAGSVDVVIGATGDRDGSPGGAASRGAVYTLFLDTFGRPTLTSKISDTQGGFNGSLDDSDRFGGSLAVVGDLDGDGTTELAVGANGDDDGGSARGAVWILFLTPGGTAQGEQKLSNLFGGFSGTPNDVAGFGSALAAMGDTDGDGRLELAVGAPSADDPLAAASGVVYLLELEADGTVADEDPIGPSTGGGPAEVTGSDGFGSSLVNLGDLDGDGFVDLFAGAVGDDDGGVNHGAGYVLFLDGCQTPASATYRNDANALNPRSYRTIPPRLGESWLGYVDLAITGHPGGTIVGYIGALEVTTTWGVLLVDPTSPSGELLGFAPQLGTGVLTFSQAVPDDVQLCGFAFETQGILYGAGLQLANAYDLVIGY